MCIRDRTNTGNTFLRDIVITDDAGTPADTTDDVDVTSCTPDLAGPVAPGDSVSCTATLNVSVDTTNIADTSGNPTDENGADLPGVADPTDSDDAVVDLDEAPGIEIVKTAGTAADGDVLTINAAGDVVYTYVVTNTGNTFLSDIVITDDAGTPADTTDDVDVTSCTPCLLYTSPSPRDATLSRMPSSA